MDVKTWVTRKITLRYGIVLGSIAVLAVISFLMLDELTRRQESTAAVVNVAGRQRMLSQRIELLARTYVQAFHHEQRSSLRRDLVEAIDLMEASHKALIEGDRGLNLPGNPSSEVRAMYFDPPMEVDRRVREFLSRARSLADRLDPRHQLHDLRLLDLNLAKTQTLLNSLDAVVRRYQTESEWRVTKVKRGAQVVVALTLLFILWSAVGVFRPLVRQVRQEMEAQETARGQAELANRSKTEFLANMSHELRTPLNSVIGFSDLMIQEVFGPMGRPEYMDYARDINDSGRHLLDLINDILDVSRIESSNFPLEEEVFNPVEVVDSCLHLVRARAMEAGLEIKLEVDKPLPFLLADQRRIKQILLNLLANAVKFTPEGAVTVRVGLDAEGWLVMSVSDTGIGIAPQDIKTALSTFGQADGSLARKFEGAGLGLPLSRRLVEMHGGDLTLESEPDVGTTVTVRFPPMRLQVN